MMRHRWLQFKGSWLAYPLAWLGKLTMKVIWMTCRVEIIGLEQFVKVAAHKPCIMALWHNRMSIVCELFGRYLPDIPYAAFLSKSRDGEPIARIVNSYPNGSCIRVAHNSRHHALMEMIQTLKRRSHVVMITPDGPRGPRYQAKMGVVAAARDADAAIVPFSWEADRCWELNTWDGFRIPKFFARIRISFGPPVAIAPGLSNVEALQVVQAALNCSPERQHQPEPL
jgi:hypothetical protein